MISQRQLFLRHLAQTSDSPMMLEIERAEGMNLFDVNGKKYIDLIAGIGVSNLGHCHPKVVSAISQQLLKHMHLMVYGEYIQSPQVGYAKLLTDHLPASLSCVYFTNSGTEATEGALKLAKRLTGRTEIISFQHSYHGHTQGALSVMGDESWKQPFRPLIPGNRLLTFNDFPMIDQISELTAAVILEPVQAEAGVILPENDFLMKIRQRCDETGALLILDEIQTGLGRTGSLFSFEQYGFVPDILLLAKSLGGGMPLGAFISSYEKMQSLIHDPALGHVTTFGGHPVCCAAGKAAMEELLTSNLAGEVRSKSDHFRKLLKHPAIKQLRSAGLLVALEFESESFNQKVVRECIANGVVTDWFLFAPNCLRIAPPLTISMDEIQECCEVINRSIETVFRSEK